MSRNLAVTVVLSVAACGGSPSGGDPDLGTSVDLDTKDQAGAGTARHLYVVSQFDRAVSIYDLAADGSWTGPSRTISGAHTGITNPTSMIVDALGAVYIVNYQASVVVFSPGAGGDATPRVTFGTDTFPVYIANNGPDGYALIANKVKDEATQATTYLGSIYPNPVVPGSAVSTEVPFVVPNQRSIATSPNANLVGDSVWTCSGVLPASSNGSAVCYGNPVTSSQAGYVTSPQFSIPASPNAVAFRGDGALVIANQLVFMNPSNITTWRLPGEGNTTPPGTPLSSIKGPATGLVSPVHVFVDRMTDRLYVADTGNASYQGSVKSWPSSVDGDVAPTHVLSGLNYPFAVAVGP